MVDPPPLYMNSKRSVLLRAGPAWSAENRGRSHNPKGHARCMPSLLRHTQQLLRFALLSNLLLQLLKPLLLLRLRLLALPHILLLRAKVRACQCPDVR